jgi:nuclear GTP-binding protein
MAKKSKKPTKPKNQATKKKTRKLRSPKKITKINPKRSKRQQNQPKKNKKLQQNKTDFELERERILAELTDDEYDELVFGNDLENMPHDIFDTYDEPSTEKENNEYIKKLISDSEVILYLLDARDVLYFLDENFEKKINPDNKLLIYVINKIDLVSQNYLKKITTFLEKKTNKNSPKLFCSCLIREKIQELYDNINFEILKFKTTMKTSKKRNNLVKIGIVGMPNVGKNSLIQSFELLINSFCEDQYILFGENKIFCVNSVPGVIYGNTSDEHLISRKYKNIEDIPNANNLLNNLFKYVEPNKLKDVYGFTKKVYNLQGLIGSIKKKYGLKTDKEAQQIILGDIVSGKISYEMSY